MGAWLPARLSLHRVIFRSVWSTNVYICALSRDILTSDGPEPSEHFIAINFAVVQNARRTWATTQQAPQLLVHLEWWRAYYHFVRPHVSLQVVFVQPQERGGKLVAQRYRQRTPAMAAGKTNRR
jgi:transposase InsO family protein